MYRIGFQYGLAPLQVAVDSALVQKKIAVGVGSFVTPPLQISSTSGSYNLPMYATMLVLFGFFNVATKLAEESDNDLLFGLFMGGMDPLAYGMSWLFVLLVRNGPLVLVTSILCKLVLVPYANFFVVFLFLTVFNMWAAAFAICIGLSGMSEKTARGGEFWFGGGEGGGEEHNTEERR